MPKKVTKTSEVVSTPPPPPIDTTPPTELPIVEETVSIKSKFDKLIQTRQELITNLKNEVKELGKLSKDYELAIKNTTSKKKKLKDFSKLRRSTGFAEPVNVSNELYQFLVKTKATIKDPSYKPSNEEEYNNWPRIPVKIGLPVARTDVTSHISKYIKEHNLQNPNEKREIIPDAVLSKIFSEPLEESKSDASKKVYTYLRLQKYVNHHFPKKSDSTTSLTVSKN